jgi:hypothetical protein
MLQNIVSAKACQLRRMITRCGLLVAMLVVSVPAVDMLDLPIGESDTSIDIAIPDTLSRNQDTPVSRSTRTPACNWTRPNSPPERVPFTESVRHPSARAALALRCTLLC